PDLFTAGGAAALVLADRFGGTEWEGVEGAMVLKPLSELAPQGGGVWARASQRGLRDRGGPVMPLQWGRLFGGAAGALASGARALVALEMDGSPQEVSLSILGVPPAHLVLPWDDSAVGGFAATKVLDAVTRRRLTARIGALWPPGPYALASAAARALE